MAMARYCVIARWVQRKTDQKLIFNGNYTNRVFCFQDTLSLCFILFIWSKNMCKHTLTHIAKKMQLLLEKIAKDHDFGDFW